MSRSRRSRGLTLLEVAVALAILALLLVALISLFGGAPQPVSRTDNALAETQDNLRQALHHLLRHACMAGTAGLPLLDGDGPCALEISNNVETTFVHELAGERTVAPGSDVLTLRGFFQHRPYSVCARPESVPGLGSDVVLDGASGMIRIREQLRGRVQEVAQPPSGGSTLVLSGGDRLLLAEITGTPASATTGSDSDSGAALAGRVLMLGFSSDLGPRSRLGPRRAGGPAGNPLRCEAREIVPDVRIGTKRQVAGVAGVTSRLEASANRADGAISRAAAELGISGRASSRSLPMEISQVAVLDAFTYLVDPQQRLLRIRARADGQAVAEPVALGIAGLQVALGFDRDGDGRVEEQEWSSGPAQPGVESDTPKLLRITVLGRTAVAEPGWIEPLQTFAVEDMSPLQEQRHYRWCRLRGVTLLRSYGW